MALTFVKIDINFFQNPKIQRISRLPGGDTFIKIYVGLLTMAMKSYSPGLIMISENMAADVADIAHHCHAKEDEVKAALSVFKKMNMVDVDGEIILIPSFEEHQKLDKVRHYNEKVRERVARYRQKQRKLLSVTGNDTSNDTVTSRTCNENVTTQTQDTRHKTQDSRHKTQDVTENINKENAESIHELPIHLKIVSDTYSAIHGHRPTITKAHAINLGKIWSNFGHEKYTDAVSVWSTSKTNDGNPHPLGFFVHSPDQYVRVKEKPRYSPDQIRDKLRWELSMQPDLKNRQRIWDKYRAEYEAHGIARPE